MSRRPSLGPFLWRYFRNYTAWMALAVAATLAFAATTVLLLPLFRLVLSDVLLAEKGDGPALLDTLSEGDEDGETGGVSGWLEETLGIDLDLHAMLEGVIVSFRDRLQITEEQVLWFLPVCMAVVMLMRSLAGFANGYIFQRIGLGATNDLRNALYDRLLHQSSRFYAAHPSGELVSRVGNDISVMQNAVSNRLLDLFQQSLTLVGLVWYLLSTHFQLAVVCLVVLPAIFYPIVRFGKGMRRTSARSQERLADISNLVAEAVRGHRVVKAFGMERFELARFRSATLRHLRVKLRAQLLANASGPVVEFLASVGAAAFLIYAGFAVRRAGGLDPSVFVTFLTNLVLLYDPIRKLNKVNLILQEALAAAQRVSEVMAIPNEIEDRPGAGTLPTLKSEIAFDRVTFAYENDIVLHEIDLRLRRGEMVALVGPSGAGKSTLVNLLPRFFDPDTGRVAFDGADIREASLASLRAQIGIVTQETVLFNDTVRNNIAYGRADQPIERVREAAAAAYADEFISQLPAGYDTVIGESGLKLSGGQRQRLAIARALLKDPPVLILDEATSHLDSESEALVQKALHNLMTGRTSLVIAHRLSTVQRADRIVVMEAGRVVESGTHDALVASRGVYRRLHDLQFRDG